MGGEHDITPPRRLRRVERPEMGDPRSAADAGGDESSRSRRPESCPTNLAPTPTVAVVSRLRLKTRVGARDTREAPLASSIARTKTQTSTSAKSSLSWCTIDSLRSFTSCTIDESTESSTSPLCDSQSLISQSSPVHPFLPWKGTPPTRGPICSERRRHHELRRLRFRRRVRAPPR